MEDVNKPPFPAPDDQELKNIIDKLANFVARNGSKFEEMTKQKQKDNSKFGFLYSGHTYYNYYRWKVSMEIAKSQTQQYQQSQKQQTPQFTSSQSAIVQQAIVQQSIKSAPWQQAQQQPTLPQMPAIPPPSYTAPPLTQSVYQQAPQPPSDLDLNEFDGMLQKLMDTGSKDAISSGRGWVFSNAKSSQHCQYIMEYILKRSLEPDLEFSQKLHIVYIINDVLHHIARKSVQDLHKAVQEVVVPIFLNAMKGEAGDGLKKLNKVLGIWETNKFLDSSVMQKLKNPESSEPILEAALQKFHAPPAATFGYPQQPTRQAPPGEYQTNPYQYQQYYQQYAQFSSNTAAYGQPSSTAETRGQQESKDSPENQAPQKSSEESNEATNEKEEEMLEDNASKEAFNQDHNNTDKQQPSKERGLQDGQQFQPAPYNQPPPFPPFYPNQGPPPQFPPDYRAPFPPFPIPPPSFNRLPPHFNEPQNFHDPGFPGRPPFGPGPPPHSYDYPPPRDEYDDMPPSEYDRHEEIDDYGPPEGFDRGMPPHVPPPPRPIIPNAMYYELPAGLMAPMVKLTDVDYKPLDPHDIRLPAPQPPSERLLAAVEAFYSPPSHERPRNSDGWEQSGLFEFYKAKLPFIKEREVRDKEREAREKVERPTERGRSRSKSISPARSPEGRRRSRSPPRGRSRSVSPPYRRTSRSRSRSPSYRRSSRSRSRSPRRYSRSRSRTPPRRRHRSRSKSRSRSRSRSRSPRHRRRSVSPLRRRSITPPSFGAFMTSNPESRLDESNVGHQLLKKMGWEGAGLGKDEKGIQDPIKAAEARHRHNQYKGIGMELNDVFDNFRYNRSYTYNRSQAERKK